MKKMLALILVALMALGMCACAEDEYVCRVASPTGAPGLALAALAVQSPENYTYVAAETITAEFASEAADFIIAPVNAGAKLYKAGKSTYKLAAVVSWGNLFFASQRPDFALADMAEAGVTLFGEGTINASVAEYALAENGIVPAKVEYLAGAANTQSLLLSDPEAIVLTAEPALTAAQVKNGSSTAWSLNSLFEKARGSEGYPQAGLFVKADTIESHPGAVADFLEKAEEACGMCASDVAAVAEAAVTMELLPNAKVAQRAIPNCAIRFVPAAEAREQIEQIVAIDPAQFGGAVPADDFYYAAK